MKRQSETEELEFDLKKVAFADNPSLNSYLTDVDVLLKAFQIFLRELKSRFRQQHTDELLADIEAKERSASVTWARVTAV